MSTTYKRFLKLIAKGPRVICSRVGTYFDYRDTNPDGSAEGLPEFVYHTPDDKYGLSPTPDKSTYTIRYAYYTTVADLAANTDTPSIPDRFHDVIVNRAKYYAYLLRSDPQAAQFAQRDYEQGLRRMRVELINRKDYMRAV